MKLKSHLVPQALLECLGPTPSAILFGEGSVFGVITVSRFKFIGLAFDFLSRDKSRFD